MTEEMKPSPEAEAFWTRAFEASAPYINRMGAQLLPDYFVRISFGEQQGETTNVHHRASVAMSQYNAYQLWKLLGELLPVKDWEASDAAAAESEASDEKEPASEVPDGR